MQILPEQFPSHYSRLSYWVLPHYVGLVRYNLPTEVDYLICIVAIYLLILYAIKLLFPHAQEWV